MASFEAEMKRQMNAAASSGEGKEINHPASECSAATSSGFFVASAAASKSISNQSRKRATSPFANISYSGVEAKRLRGASTPDNLDDDDSLCVKVEQEDGWFYHEFTCCMFEFFLIR